MLFDQRETDSNEFGIGGGFVVNRKIAEDHKPGAFDKFLLAAAPFFSEFPAEVAFGDAVDRLVAQVSGVKLTDPLFSEFSVDFFRRNDV